MPLKIEVYTEVWTTIGYLNPGDRPGSISDNKPNGSRDIYLFECSEDGSSSAIYRSGLGLDSEISVIREVITDFSKLEIVKTLKKDEEPYVMRVKTDKSLVERKLRFTHE